MFKKECTKCGNKVPKKEIVELDLCKECNEAYNDLPIINDQLGKEITKLRAMNKSYTKILHPQNSPAVIGEGITASNVQ